MPAPDPNDAEARRAYRRELRGIARMLRYSGLMLAAIGAVGLVLGLDGGWWVAPSWVSFVLGWLLIFAGIVRRVRSHRQRTSG